MTGETLIVVLPFLALILASLSVGGLWFWWNATKEQPPEEGYDSEKAASDEQSTDQDDPTIGQLFGKLSGMFQSAFSGPERSSGEAVASVSTPSLSPPSAVPVIEGEAVEVLRVLRDLADGRLIVEISGRRYYHLHEIADPQVRRRFLGNTQALARFARLEEGDRPPSGSVPPVPVPPVSVPPVSSPAWSEPAQVQPAAGKEEAADDQPRTIADEIEELLQIRLARTPEMAQRSIHVRSTPDGGVRIEVDGAFFPGVSEVTDVEVREFIQATIREWEARQ